MIQKKSSKNSKKLIEVLNYNKAREYYCDDHMIKIICKTCDC